jgi:hypothetical protein
MREVQVLLARGLQCKAELLHLNSGNLNDLSAKEQGNTVPCFFRNKQQLSFSFLRNKDR